VALGNNLKKNLQKTSKTEQNSDVQDAVVETKVIVEETVAVAAESKSTVDDQAVDRAGRTTMMCVFGTGHQEYAIPISLAKEVVKCKKMAMIPQMPRHIVGMVNVRGSILGVLDLGIYFGSNASASDGSGYLLVINDENYKMAIRIPRVPDTLHVQEDQIENLNSTMLKSVNKREYLKGIIKKDNRMIVLLNILDMIGGANFVAVSQKPVRDSE
jgi:purine-binding chemotaxis protein CheW